MQRFALALAVLALAALGLWMAFGHDPAEPAPGAGVSPTNASTDVGASETTAGAVGSGPTSERAPEAQRTEAGDDAVGSGPRRCHLTVEAIWASGETAAGIRITLRTLSNAGSRVAARARTEDDGTVRFENLHPGHEVLLYSDRGDYRRIELEAGEQTERFELKGGVAVRGVVVDAEGRPVGGATVVLQTRQTTWAGINELATTAADGTFALEQIPEGPSLGAFARGHSPSALVDLDLVDMSEPPVAVRLELGAGGGSVVGLVSDAGGAPIPGALVVVGDRQDHLMDRGPDQIVERWSPRSTTTAEDGRFELWGLPAGEAALDVRADGFGISRRRISVTTDETVTAQITLELAATVHGIATDATGAPIEGAAIRIYDREPETPFIAGGQIDFDLNLGYTSATTDADGRFEVRGVTPGTAWAFAQANRRRSSMRGRSVPYLRTALEVPPGADVEWSPQITDGLSIAGVVLYSDGKTMPGVFLTAQHEQSDFKAVGTNSYEDATFQFSNLEPGTYTVSVQLWDAPPDTARPTVKGVVPDGGRLEIRATYPKPIKEEKGTVVGRVLDVAGRIDNWKAVRVELHSEKGWFRTDGEVVDGGFRFEGVEPCRFRVVLMHGESPVGQIDGCELEPAATADVGTISTAAGGTVTFRIERGEGLKGVQPRIFVKPQGYARSARIEPGTASTWTAEGITAGAAKVSVYATGMVPIDTEVLVPAGGEVALELELVAGRSCRAEVWFPEDHGATSYHYRFVDARGRVGHEYESDIGTRQTAPLLCARTLPLGTWTFEFSTDNGLTTSTTFEVDAAPGERIERRLDLEKP